MYKFIAIISGFSCLAIAAMSLDAFGQMAARGNMLDLISLALHGILFWICVFVFIVSCEAQAWYNWRNKK